MARGWGRSEEDLAAEKEQAQAERESSKSVRPDAERITRRRSLELSLARVEDQLSRTTQPARREALESAKEELLERLRGI